MPKPWAENPKTFSLTRRSSGVPFSFRDPDGDGVNEGAASASIIWSEDFDSLADWTNDELQGNGASINANGDLNGHSTVSAALPDGYYLATVNTRWSPATGFPGKHATAEITAANTTENPNRTSTGDGKSFVGWRESYTTNFHGDHLLAWKISPSSEVYVEFLINLSNEMVQTFYDKLADDSAQGIEWQKFFRIYAENLDEADSVIDYFGPENKPEFVWSMTGWDGYAGGIRNSMSFLSRDNGGTELADNIVLPSGVASISDSGGLGAGYSPNEIAGQMPDGSDPQLPDEKNGGIIDNQGVQVDQVFGDETVWKKIGFYIKNNSDSGVADGELMQWIDDQRIFHATSIVWVESGMSWQTFDTIAIGGNCQLGLYDEANKHEQWYAIDKVRVYDGIPGGRGLI